MSAPLQDLRAPLSPLRRRLTGLALLLIFSLFAAFCIANFNKVFKPTDMVTLKASIVGNQLQKQSDVKIRGVIVGEVRSVESDGQGATLELAIDPDAISTIPGDTRATLIPKTLFGERYVSLSVPPGGGGRRLQDGDVITEDRTTNSTETEQVLNSLLPVLTAVQPQKLSDTLGAISTALSGRGKELGDTMVLLNRYLEGANPSLPDLVANLRTIPAVADIYNQASPDLLAALDNLVTTSRTLVQQRAAFESTFRTVTSASNVTTDFLAANRDTIIELSASARPTLELLARYSPEFPCLLQQLTDLTPKINNAVRPDTGLQLLVEFNQNRGPYRPSDAPEYADTRGPRCYSVTGGDAPQDPPGGALRDGSAHPEAMGQKPSPLDSFPNLTSLLTGGRPGSNPAATASPSDPTGTLPRLPVVPQSASGHVDPANLGVSNTPDSLEERRLVTEMTALQMGVAPGQVPTFAPYLTAATMRGAPVTIR